MNIHSHVCGTIRDEGALLTKDMTTNSSGQRGLGLGLIPHTLTGGWDQVMRGLALYEGEERLQRDRWWEGRMRIMARW